MKIWVTKYALTAGIKEHEAQIDGELAIVKAKSTYTLDAYFHGEGKHWHRTVESALKRAEAMRVAKIVSLRKSIKKLEALRFDEATE